MFGLGMWSKVAIATFSLGGVIGGGGYYFLKDNWLDEKNMNKLSTYKMVNESFEFLNYTEKNEDNHCKSIEAFGEWNLSNSYCNKTNS